MRCKLAQSLFLAAAFFVGMSGHANASKIVEVDSGKVRFFYDADFWAPSSVEVYEGEISFLYRDTHFQAVGNTSQNLISDLTSKSDGFLYALAKPGYRFTGETQHQSDGEATLSREGGYSIIELQGTVVSGVGNADGLQTEYGRDFFSAAKTSGSDGMFFWGSYLTETSSNVPSGNAVLLNFSYMVGVHQTGPGTTTGELSRFSFGFGIAPQPVPEPHSYILLLAGLAPLALTVRRRKQGPTPLQA